VPVPTIDGDGFVAHVGVEVCVLHIGSYFGNECLQSDHNGRRQIATPGQYAVVLVTVGGRRHFSHPEVRGGYIRKQYN